MSERIAVHFFDIHLEQDGGCVSPADRLHYPIVGGIFDGCVTCFKPAAAPSAGRVYNCGTSVRFQARARASEQGGGIALWDVTPAEWQR